MPGLGYAGGFNIATGQNATSWVYQGKYWHGIAIALDLLK